MKIGGAEALEGLPILFIKELSCIVCTDLHLGFEGVMADRGVFMPKANLGNIKAMIKKAVDMTQASSIIVDGDIKNEFSKVHTEEFNEFRDLIIYLREDVGIKRIILIKGNHDNFIDRLSAPLGFEVHRQEAIIGDFLFFHGEALPRSNGGSTLIMGHVHPSLSLFGSVGSREKLRCFLYGKLRDKRRIIILPAMNYYASGVDVNADGIEELSPVFGEMLDVNEMEAFCVGEGEILPFGKVSDLRKATHF